MERGKNQINFVDPFFKLVTALSVTKDTLGVGVNVFWIEMLI